MFANLRVKDAIVDRMREKKGIRPSTGSELKGAVIGLTSIGGTNHVSTRMTLRQFGLDIDKDVKILAIGEEKLMVDTFKMGRVDAIVVAPPFSVQLKREGFPVLPT